MTKIKLLFTCPHNGTQHTDKVRDEDNLPNTCNPDEFSIDNDIGTEDLTERIITHIHRLSGKDPYKQIAKVDREYVDHNREEPCAFEQSDLRAQRAYREYHKGILLIIEEMLPQNENGIAFLFDIHGTEKVEVNDNFIEVIIGTDEGCSRQSLTEINPDYFWGPNGLIPLLKKKGIRVFPRNQSEEIAGFELDGGYTIQTYGSSQPQPRKGLVAIQIEVIRSIRGGLYCREKFAADIADCIWTFVYPFI
jgi:N-formylglutamate amidohydrolase